MGGTLLYLPSFLVCCQHIAEKLVQLGLLADAFDEAMILVRAVDTEDVDVSTIPLSVQAFVDRLHSLLGPNRTALTCPGHTQHVCQLLDDGKIVFFIKGTALRRL